MWPMKENEALYDKYLWNLDGKGIGLGMRGNIKYTCRSVSMCLHILQIGDEIGMGCSCNGIK